MQGHVGVSWLCIGSDETFGVIETIFFFNVKFNEPEWVPVLTNNFCPREKETKQKFDFPLNMENGPPRDEGVNYTIYDFYTIL